MKIHRSSLLVFLLLAEAGGSTTIDATIGKRRLVPKSSKNNGGGGDEDGPVAEPIRFWLDKWNKIDSKDDLKAHHSAVSAYYKKMDAVGGVRSSHVSKDGSSVDCVHYLQQPAMMFASVDEVHEAISIVEKHKRPMLWWMNEIPNYDWSATPTTCGDDQVALTRPSVYHMAAGNTKYFRKVNAPRAPASSLYYEEPSVQPMQQCRDTPYDNRCYTGAVKNYNYALTATVNATDNVYVVLGLNKGEAPTLPHDDKVAHTLNQLWFEGRSLKDNCK